MSDCILHSVLPIVTHGKPSSLWLNSIPYGIFLICSFYKRASVLIPGLRWKSSNSHPSPHVSHALETQLWPRVGSASRSLPGTLRLSLKVAKWKEFLWYANPFVSYAQLTVSPLVISSQPITCPCIQRGEALDFRVPHRLFKLGNKGDEGRSRVPVGVRQSPGS